MDGELKQDIFASAREIGFDLVGITAPKVVNTHTFLEWQQSGLAGTMEYMGRNIEKRLDPQKLVPEVKSILCVGVNYFQKAPDQSETGGKISRYAWGKDYHLVIRDMLHRLAEKIEGLIQRKFTYRAFVDSAPVMEKALAVQAGLGWIGKNGCLINKWLGSFLFLGELFLDFELPPDEPGKNYCGRCQKCLAACPTGAIVKPGLMDARRCISYLMIEHKGNITADLAEKMNGWLFGCDVCQQVCPFNRKCPETRIEDFRRYVLGPQIDAAEILQWEEKDYQDRTATSAGNRAGLAQWRRNAQNLLDRR
jgi:epoxyqueuosine reductase